MTVRKWTLSKVKESIYIIHGDIIKIDESTFVGMEKRCCFIDIKYGEWWTKPSKVIYRKQGHKLRGPDKAKKTFLKKYNVDSPQKDAQIREKTKQTCLDRYGTDNPAKNDAVKEKMSASMKKTCADGTVVHKRKQSCLKRYGTENPMQNKDVNAKRIATLVVKYGVTSPAKNKEILSKMQSTCLKKYGVDNPSKHPDIIKKIEKIMMQKYGVKSSMQDPTVAAKNARSQSKSIILFHWKTKEELVCVGTWEIKVVNYLNKNKINYKWQSKTFTLPSGKTYRPDLYLVDIKKWIEIKGYFRKDALEKWNWFHNNYSSELWDKQKLKAMKVL